MLVPSISPSAICSPGGATGALVVTSPSIAWLRIASTSGVAPGLQPAGGCQWYAFPGTVAPCAGVGAAVSGAAGVGAAGVGAAGVGAAGVEADGVEADGVEAAGVEAAGVEAAGVEAVGAVAKSDACQRSHETSGCSDAGSTAGSLGAGSIGPGDTSFAEMLAKACDNPSANIFPSTAPAGPDLAGGPDLGSG